MNSISIVYFIANLTHPHMVQLSTWNLQAQIGSSSGDIPYSICLGDYCNNGNFKILKWRYLPYIRPINIYIYKAYGREYHHKIWPYMVQYLHLRILEFPLIQYSIPVVPHKAVAEVSKIGNL